MHDCTVGHGPGPSTCRFLDRLTHSETQEPGTGPICLQIPAKDVPFHGTRRWAHLLMGPGERPSLGPLASSCGVSGRAEGTAFPSLSQCGKTERGRCLFKYTDTTARQQGSQRIRETRHHKRNNNNNIQNLMLKKMRSKNHLGII